MGATGVGTSAWRKDQKGPQAILDAAEVSTPSSIDPTLTRISILRVFIFLFMYSAFYFLCICREGAAPLTPWTVEAINPPDVLPHLYEDAQVLLCSAQYEGKGNYPINIYLN